MRFMGIQTRMAWQDFLTDEERQELEAAEADFAAAKKALDPVKARRDATRKKLKIRCDMRMHRAKGENSEG
ncbi:hypothetical protein OO25_07335 [Phaeobacter sp. S60]|nr:hypothetical protein OO25_07335 [Phaeobacter sp. S60]